MGTSTLRTIRSRRNMQESYSLRSNHPDLPILKFIASRETFTQNKSLSCKTCFTKVEENKKHNATMYVFKKCRKSRKIFGRQFSERGGRLNLTVEAAYQGRYLTGAKVLYYMEHVSYYSNCYYLPRYYNFKT